MKNTHLHFKKCIIILFWLGIWQLIAALMHNDILLVGPIQVVRALFENIAETDFLKIVIYSFGRIGLGFALALALGFALGALSYRYKLLDEFLAPFMITLKSIPVASFVVLLLIWFGSDGLSFFSSFLVVFPSVYVSTISGFKSTSGKLLEMADVFGVSGINRYIYLYRPAFMPYLISCLKVSLGMSWKSGVAAEVIGVPGFSLGERLYMSKIYLDTAGLFAWTLMVILLSFLFEKAVMYLIEAFAEWKPYPVIARRKVRSGKKTEFHKDIPDINICNISKAYGSQQVFNDFSLKLNGGGRYCLMAPSGSGKTTLLRLLNHIEQPDSGTIQGLTGPAGTVFQEDRLCEEYDVITNIMLTAKGDGYGKDFRNIKPSEKIRTEASNILPAECLNKKVSELSGGMRRRCAILRALLSDSDVLIMDEPFAGLDEENRKKTATYILDKLEGRTLLVTTHREEDVALLDAIKCELPNCEY